MTDDTIPDRLARRSIPCAVPTSDRQQLPFPGAPLADARRIRQTGA